MPDIKRVMIRTVWFASCRVLAWWQIGKKGTEAVTLLTGWLADAKENDRTRKEVAVLLGEIGPRRSIGRQCLFQCFATGQ